MSDQAASWDFDWDEMGWPFIVTTSGNRLPIIAGGAEEDGDSDEDDADGTEADEDSDEDDDSQEDESSDDGKTFTQDDVNRITARATRKAKRGAVDFKELGFNSKKELQDFIEAKRSKETEEKDEEETKREEAIEAAKKEAVEAVLTQADRKLLKAEFRVAARDAGVPKDRLDDAFALAQNLEDWEDVSVDDDGDVQGLDDAFFETLKESKSYLFESESSDEDEDDEDDDRPNSGTRSKGKRKNKTDRKALLERYPGLRPVAN